MRIPASRLFSACALFGTAALAGPTGAPIVPTTTATTTAWRSGEEWTQAELERVTGEVQRDVEELRGLEFKRPVKVALTDKEGFLKYAMERLERSESPEEIAASEMAAKLLGLVPHDMDLLQVTLDVLEEQVGGFYDPATETFYLMDGITGGLAKVILAHELTHALDDQHFDIDGILESLGGDTDAELAYQSVVEGSGVAVMNQWAAANVSQLNFDDIQEMSSMGAEELDRAPPFVWKPLLAVYLRGEAFLRHSTSVANLFQRKVDPSDIDLAFKQPPLSTEQILHPNKYWKESQRDDPQSLEYDLDAVPEGWNLLDEDTLGELMIGLVCAPFEERVGLDAGNVLATLGVEYTSEASEGWGGDRMLLFERGGGYLVFSVSIWDTPEDADEFRSTMQKLSGDVVANLKQMELDVEVAEGETADSGFRVGRGKQPTEVRLVSFAGIDGKQVDRLLETIAHRVVPAAKRKAEK